jgi:hypothetical protein
MSQRSIWCPNVVLLDPMESTGFMDEERLAVFNMAVSDKPLLYVKIGSEPEAILGARKILEQESYSFYKHHKKDVNPIFPIELEDGCPHFYYIFTQPEFVRLAFVHFIDILGTDYRIVCEASGLTRFTTPWALVLPNIVTAPKDIIKGLEHLKQTKVISISELTN